MKLDALDQRVSVKRPEQGQGPRRAWATRHRMGIVMFSAWAAVEPQIGLEYIAAAPAQLELTTRIRLRSHAGVTMADRVIHDGATYNIQPVIDYRSAKCDLVLRCVG